MAELSIIFGYRNRDTERVQKCLDSLALQTYKNFKVIFIDYGSDIFYSEAIKPLVESYSFATYYYSNTKGYPWNRSHALNTGIKLAHSNYILFADIDLIYSPDAIEALMAKASDNNSVFGSMFYLKKSFNQWNELPSLRLSSLKDSGDAPIGAVFLVNKPILERIQGFDEYYCFWGGEDRDLYYRLDQTGIKHVAIDKYTYPIFHQWHPIVSDRKKNFFPEKWWDEINIHYSLNKKNIIRNDKNWGRIFNDEDRPIFKAKKASTLILSKFGRSYDKAEVIDSIVDSINKLDDQEFLEIILKKNKSYAFLFFIIKIFNLFARFFRLPLGLDYIENVEREKYFYPQNDVFYLIWYLIRKENLIRDYEMLSDHDTMIIRLMRQNDEG